MKKNNMYYVILLVFFTSSAFAQHVEVNGQNKTIAVGADSSVTADAEIAILHIAYSNYGKTKEEAFQTNLSVSNQVIGALSSIGINKEQIESDDLLLERVETPSVWTDVEKRDRQFKARQGWKIRVPVAKAENTVQVAVRAGANESTEPDWEVANKSALQAKASVSALERAKKVAEEMANGLGVKLGHLVYASNRAPALADFLDRFAWGGGGGGGGMMVEVQSGKDVEKILPPKLKLFPQKVKQEATVFAVFSIE